jgi:spore germination protein KC
MKHILVLTFLLLLCTGCWDKLELEEQAYVVVIGLDKAEEKGEVIVTLQIGNPQVGSVQKGDAGNEPASEIVTFTATDILTARELANAFVTRDISFNHMRTLIVSEKYAKSDEFINTIYSALRERQIKRDVNLIVCKEDARDFIRNNKPTTETRPHKYFQFMIKQVTEMGFSPHSDLHRFFVMTEGDADLFLAIYATTEEGGGTGENEDEYLAGEIEKEGGNKTQIMGSAVFKEGKMIGTLSGEETRLSYALDKTVNVHSMLVTYEDPIKKDYRIAARLVKKEKTEIKMDLSERKPKIDVKVPFTLEILSIPSLVNYVTNKKNQNLLKATIEKKLSEKTEQFIREKLQQEFKGQPFFWSLTARKHFLTLHEYKQYDWMKSFPEARVNVKFVVEISDFGKELTPPSIPKVKD